MNYVKQLVVPKEIVEASFKGEKSYQFNIDDF